MTKSLSSILKYMYPDADPMQDYAVMDRKDGNGPFIEYWDQTKLGPMPTEQEILAQETDALAYFEMKKAECEPPLSQSELKAIRALLAKEQAK